MFIHHSNTGSTVTCANSRVIQVTKIWNTYSSVNSHCPNPGLPNSSQWKAQIQVKQVISRMLLQLYDSYRRWIANTSTLVLKILYTIMDLCWDNSARLELHFPELSSLLSLMLSWNTDILFVTLKMKQQAHSFYAQKVGTGCERLFLITQLSHLLLMLRQRQAQSISSS